MKGHHAKCPLCDGAPAELMDGLEAAMVSSDAWPELLAARRGNRSTTGAALRSMQVARGVTWLDEHGVAGSPQLVRAHLDHRIDGIDAMLTLVPEPQGALQLMNFYSDAIAVGRAALAKLQARMDDPTAELTNAELLAIANLGGRYAMSAATLRQRGQSPLPGDEGYVPPEDSLPPKPPELSAGDVEDGFLAGSAPAPSKRMGHSRVRVVEGVARPVYDEGPMDRARYNERADQEGRPRI